MIYLDYAGSSLLNKEIFDKIYETNDFLDLFGNPSSIHNAGIRAKNMLRMSKDIISNILGCKNEEIILTSGGTESDNMALFGIMYDENPQYKGRNEIIVSKIEHPAILESAKELENRGFIVKYVDVMENGIVNINQLEDLMSDKIRLVSIMTVNNEIGVIQPIDRIYKIVKQYGAIFHTDAVQAVGLCPINVSDCDLMSLSAHKFGALKGTGILYKKKDLSIKPFIFGGGQEQGLRAGTENVFGCYIMAICLLEALNNWNNNRKRIEDLRNDFEKSIKNKFIDRVRFNNYNSNRVCNNINLSFKDIDSKTLQVMLMIENIDVSVGSACNSEKDNVSYVLNEIKVPTNYINGTLRITLNYDTTKEQLDILFNTLTRCVEYLYNIIEGGI